MQLQQVTIGKNLTFDLYDQGVSAGNQQPSFGESSEKIDLNELLITNEIATFCCRVSGRSMEPHMRDGDVLMVDKSIEPKAGKVVIVAINGVVWIEPSNVPVFSCRQDRNIDAPPELFQLRLVGFWACL